MSQITLKKDMNYIFYMKGPTAKFNLVTFSFIE